TNQPFLLKVRQSGNRCFDRTLSGTIRGNHDPEVHHLKDVEAKVAQVVVDGLRQLFGRGGWQPGSVAAPACTDLGNNNQLAGVRRKRLAYEEVCDVRTVIVARVDMIYS